MTLKLTAHYLLLLGRCVHVRGQLVESVLSFHPGGPGMELRSSGLTTKYLYLNYLASFCFSFCLPFHPPLPLPPLLLLPFLFDRVKPFKFLLQTSEYWDYKWAPLYLAHTEITYVL